MIDTTALIESVKKLIFYDLKFNKTGTAKLGQLDRNDQLMLISIGNTKVVILDDGQLEIYGPIYNCYIERLDYDSIEEAVSKLRHHLEYIESHYDELLLKPVVVEPILNVWINKLKSLFRFR